MKTTVIAVTGSREHPDPLVVTSYIADYVLNIAPGPVVVRHGACPGEQSVDQAVATWIDQCGEWLGVTADPMPADWDHCTDRCPPGHRRMKKPGDTAHPGIEPDYCPAAGPLRNARMLGKQPAVKLLVAAPHGPSVGTRGCMKIARAAGIEIREVTA
ncbi:hypothetical protein AB0I27_22970 [Streptomyces sp. NPDC050597]|uniref:hypothetical protein n=1 Tax=Streptomyces sp. NPDC050597 TaxID=3157212 RepID=UPI00343F632E